MAELRLTYGELADRLGIKPEAARQRAKRRQREGRWRILLDNAGRAVVLVDDSDLAAEPTGRAPDHRPDEPPDAVDHRGDDRGNDRPDVRPDHRDGLLAELVGRAERAERKLELVEAKMEDLVGAARREVDAARQAAEAARERAARLEGEAAGVRATALADVATARAEVEARDELLVALRAELERARRPFWSRWRRT